MADASEDGLCPIKDHAPVLLSDNAIVVDLFKQLEGSGSRVEANKKTYVYLKPGEIKALFDIHDIEQSSRSDMMDKLVVLQDEANELRPKHKTPKKIK